MNHEQLEAKKRVAVKRRFRKKGFIVEEFMFFSDAKRYQKKLQKCGYTTRLRKSTCVAFPYSYVFYKLKN
jgi:hypothetical protein